MSQVPDLPQPYLLFLGDTTEKGYAKTAFGLRDWAGDRCIGEWACDGATVTTGLPRLTPKEARARGARALVIGVANSGGVIGESWIPSLVEALESGLDIISGMHAKLGNVPQLKATAERHGRRLIDVRTPPKNIPIATGAKRSGKRLLTVGTGWGNSSRKRGSQSRTSRSSAMRAVSSPASLSAQPRDGKPTNTTSEPSRLRLVRRMADADSTLA